MNVCGCKYENEITYCPLHAAAQEMLNVLISVKDELVQFHGNVHGDCTDKGRLTCPTWEAIYKARKAIVNAERS